MDNNRLAEQIFRNGKYKKLCLKLTNGNKPLAEDLHSEFIRAVLETKDPIDQRDNMFIDVFCVGIIHNIWNNRGRHKQHIDGQTSPLFQYSSTFEIPVRYNDEECRAYEAIFSKPDTGYDLRIDYKYQKVQNFIEKESEHKDKDRMYKARIFKYAVCESKNVAEFAKTSKINYYAIRKAIKQFKAHAIKYLKVNDE
jgi:hypothetical protein